MFQTFLLLHPPPLPNTTRVNIYHEKEALVVHFVSSVLICQSVACEGQRLSRCPQ